MRTTATFLLTVFAASLPAQQFFIPDNDATTGNCNLFPFGGTGGQNIKYQMLVPAADLGNQPGLITGMGFAQCGQGTHSFGGLEVVLCHQPATSLSATFAQNLTAGAVTVLSSSAYEWNLPANSWQEVGLQGYFAYNGVDNLVVQVIATGSVWTASGAGGSQGMRTAARPRVYAANWTAAPPAAGTLATTNALKIELDFGSAKVSNYGHGCAGSNGLSPNMDVTGLPQLGQTILFGLSNALPTTIGMRVLALDNGAPFPVDLAIVGMPGCQLYEDLFFLDAALTSATGAASLPLAVPNNTALNGVRFYGQWACLDAAANAFGWTTSNYVRVQAGS